MLQSIVTRSFEATMVLSVIIVNYNVKYFLEQCLSSLYTAGERLDEFEVFVVDNASTDGSHQYLCNRFPAVKWIINSENKGFGAANNQALAIAKGRFVLFLNPDTLLPEDGLEKCVSFMQQQPDAGALGVRMIDGAGSYLKESKRGFPTPWVAFCKMSGITSIFPKNRLFSGYYRGNLPENAINKVDALAGAFLLVRKEVLEKTGGFDERFFMYAEDIDLCYRIFKAGYANYYYPPVTIIHFKGESTQKNATYIKHFYNAMILFVRKHATNSLQRFYARLLEIAIHFRSLLAKLVISDPVAEAPSIPLNIRVDGDVDSKNEVVGILASNGENSNEILFCEGKSMRFSTIFAKIQEMDPGQRIYFHAGGTRSVIGSPSSKNRGVFIPLDNK